MSWVTVRVSDLGKVITGNTPPRKMPELYGQHTIFIKPTDIAEERKYTYFPEECYSELGFKKYKRSLIPKGSTCVVTIGSIGKKLTKAHCDCFINQAMNAVIPSPEFDEEFVYYLLKYNLGILKTLDSGTASGRENVSKSSFSSIKVAVPREKNIQRAIGQILSAYDDLIENNLKRIKLLEEMAQITYEEWFVRRRINGSIISDENIRNVEMKELISDYKNGGWGKEEPEGKFTEEGYVIRGTDIPDVLSGNFNYVPKRFHTQSNLEPRTLVAGDIIMEMSNGNMGNVGRSLYYDDSFYAILGNKIMCASFCKMARAKSIGYSYLVDAHIKYIHKNNQMLVYKSQGANGINNFQFEQMIEEEVINIPENKQALDELISYFDGVYKNLSVLRKQIHFLKEARDILLPRLMTGVIDVESYDPAQLLNCSRTPHELRIL